MTRRPGALPCWLALFLALGGASGCIETPAVMSPASRGAGEILWLTWIITAIAVFVFVVVAGLLLYCAFRFRAGPDAPIPRQVASNVPLEIAWTAIPALVLIGVLILTVRTVREVIRPEDAAAATMHVRVIGHQWWWEFQYLDQQVTTANEAHVPVGETIELQLESDNVIHSFWVPRLFGKTDVIPGHHNHLYLHTDEAGVYRGQCAEFCGIQHANVRLLVVADTRDRFAAWVQAQKAAAHTPIDQQAQNGQRIFLESTCSGCHTVQGTSAQGTVGPDLTHVASRAEIAAGALPFSAANLERWLIDPQAVKPGADMPDLHLDGDTISALVAYLAQLE